MEITQRRLTKEESQLLNKLIKETPNITGYSVSELLHFTDVFVAEEDSKLIGVCINKDLLGKWSEIAVLYVLNPYRDKGIGSILFNEALRELARKNRDIYTVSRNPIVIRLMKKSEMIIVDKIYKLPVKLNAYNFTFALNLYRIKEYLRKDLGKGLKPFVYGYKYSVPLSQ